MRILSHLAVRALLAAVMLGALAGTASAGRFSLSERTFRATWAELEFINFPATVRCPVTLEGSFHSRTVAKTREALIGYVTAAKVTEASCISGIVRMLAATLPWHIRYASFNGTLPVITQVNISIIGASFLVQAREVFGGQAGCLYVSNAEKPLRMALNREGAGAIFSFRPDETIQIPAEVNGVLFGGCQLAIRVGRESTTATILNALSRITITLI